MMDFHYRPDITVNSELEACAAFSRMRNRQSSVMEFVRLLHIDARWHGGKWFSMRGAREIQMYLWKQYEWNEDEAETNSVYMAMTRKNGEHCCIRISPHLPYRVYSMVSFRLSEGKISEIFGSNISVRDTFVSEPVYLRHEQAARSKIKELVDAGLLFTKRPSMSRGGGDWLDRLFT